jgi:hypothetical protein
MITHIFVVMFYCYLSSSEYRANHDALRDLLLWVRQVLVVDLISPALDLFDRFLAVLSVSVWIIVVQTDVQPKWGKSLCVVFSLSLPLLPLSFIAPFTLDNGLRLLHRVCLASYGLVKVLFNSEYGELLEPWIDGYNFNCASADELAFVLWIR